MAPIFSNAFGSSCNYTNYACYINGTNSNCASMSWISFSNGNLSYLPQNRTVVAGTYYLTIYGIMQSANVSMNITLNVICTSVSLTSTPIPNNTYDINDLFPQRVT